MSSTGPGEAVSRAGTKVILLGEHAVVHGTDALVLGLDGGTTVAARRGEQGVVLSVPKWSLAARTGGSSKEDIALENMVNALGVPKEGVSLEASTEIPPGAGLGSSASIAAASVLALMKFWQVRRSTGEVLEAINASERVFHLNPSGVDAEAVLKSGVLVFNRSAGVRRFKASLDGLLVVNTRKPGKTSDMVALFDNRVQTDREDASRRIKEIGILVERSSSALQNGDFEALGKFMNRNHEHLRWFGVSSPQLDDICRLALENGAFGAKMTGGGGGGCAVVLTDERFKDRIVLKLDEAGYETVIQI